jgi:hypothetical protein
MAGRRGAIVTVIVAMTTGRREHGVRARSDAAKSPIRIRPLPSFWL